MASLIDPTKPASGVATTQSVRDNFLAAKNEIEALQDALASVPTGVGSVTMTAGEALAARDIAVLGPDLRVYKPAGGPAVSTDASTLPAYLTSGVCYNPATNTVVMMYRDPVVTTSIRVVSGTVNEDGTTSLGAGFLLANIGGAASGVLTVCHVGGDVFFTCWRSSATQMSAVAFLANGTTSSAPQPVSTWTTASTGSGFNSTAVVCAEGKVFAATGAITTDPKVYWWPAPSSDCILGTRTALPHDGQNYYCNGHAALYYHAGFLYWFYYPSTVYVNQYTRCSVVDLSTMTIAPWVNVTGLHETHYIVAHSMVKVDNEVWMLGTNHATTAGYRNKLLLKRVVLDGGTVSIPGGTDSFIPLITPDANAVCEAGLITSGSVGYDAASSKLVVLFSHTTFQRFKTYHVPTGTVEPPITSPGTIISGPAANTIKQSAESVAVPGKGVYFLHYLNTTTGRVWGYKPEGSSTLTEDTYIGLVKEPAAANQPVTLLTAGAIASGFSGLSPATTYYALPSNTISTVQWGGVRVGVAVSPTQIILKG